MRYGRDPGPLYLWRLLARVGRQELALLLRVLLVASALWAFATLANAMVEGETHAFDRAVLLLLRAPGAPAGSWRSSGITPRSAVGEF